MPRITPGVLAILALSCLFLPANPPQYWPEPTTDEPRVITFSAASLEYVCASFVAPWEWADVSVTWPQRRGATQPALLMVGLRILHCEPEPRTEPRQVAWRVTVEGTPQQIRGVGLGYEMGGVFTGLGTPERTIRQDRTDAVRLSIADIIGEPKKNNGD